MMTPVTSNGSPTHSPLSPISTSCSSSLVGFAIPSALSESASLGANAGIASGIIIPHSPVTDSSFGPVNRIASLTRSSAAGVGEKEVEEERVALLETKNGEIDLEGGGGGVSTPRDGVTPRGGGGVAGMGTKKLVKEWSFNNKRRQMRQSIESLGGLSEIPKWVWGGSPYSGLLCMAAASFSYALLTLCTQLFGPAQPLPSFQALSVRCVVMALIAGGGLKRASIPLTGSPPMRLLLLGRAGVGFLSMAAFLACLTLLSTADASLLSLFSPLLGSFLAFLVLHDKLSGREVLSMVVSILGAILIIRPPLLFPNQIWGVLVSEEAALSEGRGRGSSYLGFFWGIVAAVCGGVSLCLLRALGRGGEHPLSVVFSFSAVSAPAAIAGLFIFQKPILVGPAEGVGILLTSLAAFSSQLFLARGLQLERTGRAASMQFLEVWGTYVLSVLVLGETLSWIGALGIVVIGASIAFNVLGRSDVL